MSVTNHGTMICQPSLTPRATMPSLWQMLLVWRTRRQLASLDSAQLCDIGVSEEAARTEVRRPVWDVPATWRV